MSRHVDISVLVLILKMAFYLSFLLVDTSAMDREGRRAGFVELS